MIAGVAKIPKEFIGAIHLMPKQTMVDVAAAQVETVLKKLNGIKFKGLKLSVAPAI